MLRTNSVSLVRSGGWGGGEVGQGNWMPGGLEKFRNIAQYVTIGKAHRGERRETDDYGRGRKQGVQGTRSGKFDFSPPPPLPPVQVIQVEYLNRCRMKIKRE